MNKKRATVFLSLFLMCLTMFHATPSNAMVLPVPVVGQQQSQWCWAASSEAIENYYKKYPLQSNMADYLANAHGYLGTNCGQYPVYPAGLPTPEPKDFTCNTPPSCYCNQPNYFAGYPGSVSQMLTDHSVQNTVVGPLSQADVQAAIYAGNPFMMGWTWRTNWRPTGGHALVGYGSVGDGANQLVYYMDPASGGSAKVDSYNWVLDYSTNRTWNGTIDSGHSWDETIKTTGYVASPVGTLQVWQNGALKSGSTVYVSRSLPFYVKAGLAPNGFAGTQADWWFLAQYHGVLYYRTSAGSWVTTATPVWQKPLATMDPTTIWSGYAAAGDSVTFYVGVDLTQNGIRDNPYYYTSVTVIGQ